MVMSLVFLKSQCTELSKNVYFYPILTYSFRVMILSSKTCRDTPNLSETPLKMPVCNANYENRLKRLKIYSLEQRREGFMIIHMYKIVIGVLPNPSFKIHYHERTKTTVRSTFHPLAPAWVKTLRGRSFFLGETQSYNTPPKEIREQEDRENPGRQHVKKFKWRLDDYIAKIPDIPGQYISNSLQDVTHR